MVSRNKREYILERADGASELYPQAALSGYSFNGWKDCEGRELSLHSLAQEKVFYADWVDDIAPEISASTTQSLSGSQTITIVASDEGSGIEGYYIGLENPAETNVIYVAEAALMVSETGTYYCSARDNAGNVSTETITFHMISLNANGGNVDSEKVLVKENTTFVLPEASRYGYHGGWYEEGADVSTTETCVMQDCLFTMQWIANTYVVSFDANGGVFPDTDGDNGATLEKEVTFDDVYGELPVTPEKTGYLFLGWYTATTDGEQITAESQVAIGENHTLYAMWKEKTYTTTQTFQVGGMEYLNGTTVYKREGSGSFGARGTIVSITSFKGDGSGGSWSVRYSGSTFHIGFAFNGSGDGYTTSQGILYPITITYVYK